MKKIISLTLMTVLVLLGGPVGAQSYDGTSLAEGIFYTPANVGPASTINFAVTGLEPNSDVTFELFNADAEEVDGLQVAGAVVLRADASGGFNGNVRLPANVEAGVLSLSVTATSADGSPYTNSLAITVTQAAVDNPTAADAASLALTGSSSSTRIFGGVALVALGAALVTVASQRRRTETVNA